MLEGFIHNYIETLEPSGEAKDIHSNILATAGSLRRHCGTALEQLEKSDGNQD